MSRRKPVEGGGVSGKGLMYVVWGAFIVSAVALCFAPDRSEPFKAQGTHRERRDHAGDDRRQDDISALNDLIDRSPTAAELKTARAMLYLFSDDGKPVKFKAGRRKKGA